MGKETKIGLAVLGALVSIFGVLLFRYFQAGGSVDSDGVTRAAAEPLTPARASDEPNVVAAHQDHAGGTGESLWDANPRRASSETAGEAPPASYMPTGTEPADAAQGHQDLADESPATGERPSGGNPFQNRGPHEDGTAEPNPPSDGASHDRAEPPPDDVSSEPRRNPLRRLSAEVPLEAPQENLGAEPSAELPDRSTDPYALDEQPARPANAANAAEPQIGAPLMPEDNRSAPDVVGPQSAEPAAADLSRPGTADAFGERPPSGDAGRAAIEDGWQNPGSADRPSPDRGGPLPLENGMYTVQPNDTLWTISEKVYGTGGYFKAIAAHNRANLPRADRLTVGIKVAVPPVGELEESYPTLCPKQRKSALVPPRAVRAAANVPSGGDVYVVEEGDTLFDIARYELGKASRWAEIYELNREKLGEDFDYLQPGVELKLPPKARDAESIGRGPDSRHLR